MAVENARTRAAPRSVRGRIAKLELKPDRISAEPHEHGRGSDSEDLAREHLKAAGNERPTALGEIEPPDSPVRARRWPGFELIEPHVGRGLYTTDPGFYPKGIPVVDHDLRPLGLGVRRAKLG